MTNLAKLALARIDAIERANLVIACQRGCLARAHRRPRDGVLVPKEINATPGLLAEWHQGWDDTDAILAAIEQDG